MKRMLVHNIGELATPLGRNARGGAAQGEIMRLRDAYLLIENGRIAAVGGGSAPDALLANCDTVDAGGCLVTPGLVDPHTHLVFGGWRQWELALKLEGYSYLDILASGGGILSTVRETRAASEDDLYQKAHGILSEMLSMGVTTCEAKSGYGLSLEEELKQLRVVSRLNETQPVKLVSTFMAAHAVPEEYKAERSAYIDLVIRRMIPAVAQEKLAEFCDVFCEKGVFDADEARKILLAAQDTGMRTKVHADEIENIGGAEMAGEIGAISAEHLLATTDSGIRALADGGVVACLLPATSFYLNKPFARARDMIAAGVPVAVGSDFNPGSCPCLSLQLTMNLACYKYGMRPEEVLTAATLNAAAAIGRAELLGSLEQGKAADLVLWDAPDLEYIFYRFGSNLAGRTIKGGRLAQR